MLTILASFAREESQSISECVTWGVRKLFADGKVNMPYKRFMGYRKYALSFRSKETAKRHSRSCAL